MLRHDDGHYLAAEVVLPELDQLLAALVRILEAPNLKYVLFADREESLALWDLVDLQHGRLVYGEASVDVVQVVDADEDYHAFGQADHQKPVCIALLVDGGVGWVDRLLVAVLVREDFAVVLWRLGVAAGYCGDLLAHTLALVVL